MHSRLGRLWSCDSHLLSDFSHQHPAILIETGDARRTVPMTRAELPAVCETGLTQVSNCNQIELSFSSFLEERKLETFLGKRKLKTGRVGRKGTAPPTRISGSQTRRCHHSHTLTDRLEGGGGKYSAITSYYHRLSTHSTLVHGFLYNIKN